MKFQVHMFKIHYLCVGINKKSLFFLLESFFLCKFAHENKVFIFYQNKAL